MNHPDPKEELISLLPNLRGFAMSLTRNRSLADDMMQDTIVKAWARIEQFEPGSNMKAWLFTILRNTYYTRHQKMKREVADVDGAFSDNLSVKPDHDGRLQMRDFRTAFETLPVEQREALILVGAQGFSYEEAAETAGVALGTIKSRVNRARANLTEIMGLDSDDAFEMTDSSTVSVINRDIVLEN